MESYLKETFDATDEELTYLKEITDLRLKKLNSSTINQMNYGSPSVVIDDFLYHGDLTHALNVKLLNRIGIRHILRLCDSPPYNETSENFHVLWINLCDEFKANIRKHFEETNQFLYDCKQKQEKVLVHCEMGISRSSSIVLAYLMKFHHDSLIKAYDYLFDRRRIAVPNLSFFLQLIRYENELRVKKDIDENEFNDNQRNSNDCTQDLVSLNKEFENGI